MPSYTDPNCRHDFVLLFDVLDGNPNGDPDGGNLPRTDAETMQGLVTDVCLKRKVRNYVEVYCDCEATEAEKERLKIFVEHQGVLNEQIRRAYVGSGLPVSEPVSDVIKDPKVLTALRNLKDELPKGFTLEEEEEGDNVVSSLAYSGELDAEELKAAYKDLESLSDSDWKAAKKFVEALVKKSGKPAKTGKNIETAKNWMCANFYDVRMFGAVMSTGLNAGQVRGPLQLTFARSIDPVLPLDWSITRMAVTDAKEDRVNLQTMGRKTQIPYGLYRGFGFFSPFLAKQTGVTEADLALFWQALQGMWELDRSASRGLMALRGLYIFSHEKPLGNAPAHKLFDRVTVQSATNTPRAFTDYGVDVNEEDLPEGVTLTKLV
ncbi:type I-C CRISPR-associated protein Cas7/Csd2 [Spirulina sp. CCNP1310]|uniref:type I-C CRISPR-associated protein Cas7/Csd2 n=1 Tax=Spirulina sp. CCNP1310 TaxID=3110249 RepID=UPI002B219700|nr:type I-C CRISPR-associated protein Cas7/Csd2 [Spirulina sp. CCNP1310]MEA5419877.1 type I-C CRISPR-associated protein Cas7/Csd2 [Spirulina sp. CCNP1310]